MSEIRRRVNVDAPFHLTRAAFPVMKRQGYGRFVEGAVHTT